jgi:F-type H+-transporting ATPase subunit delta
MKLSKESRKISKALFRSSFTEGVLDEAKVRNIVQLLIEAKPRHYFDILKGFQRLVRLEMRKHHAVIESAEPLSASISEKMEADLRAKHGRDLDVEHKVNPALIAGIRVQIGSNVWDGSIQNRLARLKEEFNQS